MPGHAVLAFLFAVLAAPPPAALAGHICSYCNSNGRLSCAYPDNYACRVAMYNATIKPCSKFGPSFSGFGSGSGGVLSPGPSGSSYLCPVSIIDGKGNEFAGPAGTPKVYTCESIQSVKAACTCAGKCDNTSPSTTACPSRVPVMAFENVCARPECEGVCDSTLAEIASALKALNAAGQALVNDAIVRASRPSSRRALLEEATISRGQSDASPVKVGQVGMTAEDVSTLANDVGAVSSDAGKAFDALGFFGTSPAVKNLVQNRDPDLKPKKSTPIDKYISVLNTKVFTPLQREFAKIAKEAADSAGNPSKAIKAVNKLLSKTRSCWECLAKVTGLPDFGGGRAKCKDCFA